VDEKTLNDVQPGHMIESDPLLDIEEAARFLNVSETSLRRWTNEGRLACLRVGRRRERRFRQADLLAFAESEPAGNTRSRGRPHPGTHLIGLYSSDDGAVQQAVTFLSEGFTAGTVSFLLGDATTRGRILAALQHRHPALQTDTAEGRLVVSDYAASAAEQIAWWESRLTRAMEQGATLLRAIGDAGAFLRTGASQEQLMAYEQEFERRIAHRFPLITMCQYDVRRLSGPIIIDSLKAHPDCFRHPPERILA
jgi:excisionase family DNA binding protein